MTRRVPFSYSGVSSMSDAERRQHAKRMLAQGWEAESVSEQTGLQLDQVRAIAAQTDFDELSPSRPP